MFADLQISLALLLITLTLLGSGCLIAATVSILRFSKRVTLPTAVQPAVTILKPLCGNEHDLAINLRSFCELAYPSYQIVFGIQNPADAALPVVRALIAEFPQLDIHVVVNSTRTAHNLKVANLQNMLAAAKHEYLVMADSDMRVTPDYLATVTAPLADASVGAVTCLYRGTHYNGFWSDLGCLQINHNFLPQALLGNDLNIGKGCFGATIALRRETLEQIGGFAAIGGALADDHALGEAIRKLGKSIVLSSCLIDDVISEPRFATLFDHEIRWARTICMVQRGGYIGATLTHPVALGILAVALGCLPELALDAFGLAILTRFATSFIVNKTLRLPQRLLWLLPLRDMLSFAVFIDGFFGRTVSWRSETVRVTRNGYIKLQDGDLVA